MAGYLVQKMDVNWALKKDGRRVDWRDENLVAWLDERKVGHLVEQSVE